MTWKDTSNFPLDAFRTACTAGAVLRLQYDGRFGEKTQQKSANLKGSVPF